jgi:hypothetical protein
MFRKKALAFFILTIVIIGTWSGDSCVSRFAALIWLKEAHQGNLANERLVPACVCKLRQFLSREKFPRGVAQLCTN